jgi:hypothetical protein
VKLPIAILLANIAAWTLLACAAPRIVYYRTPVAVPCRDSSAVVSSFGAPLHCDHGAILTYAPYEHPSNDRHDLFVATCRCPEPQAYATVPTVVP